MRPAPRLIALALILTGVSLPLLIAGAMAPALAVLWILLALAAIADLAMSTPAARVAASVSLPSVGYAGRTVLAQVRVTPRRGVLPQGIMLRLIHARELEVGDRRLRADGRGAAADLPMHLSRRGRFRVAGIALKWPSRLGLFEVVGRWPARKEISVLPDVTPVLTGMIHAQMLPMMEGQKDMRLTGGGSEFRQFREFVRGMDPRSIDWQRSARGRQLIAREMRAERNHQIVLCIDGGRLMREEVAGLPKIDRAINGALALAWAGGLGGDLVGLYSFDSRPRLYIPPVPGRLAFSRLKAAAAGLGYSGVESNPTLALTHLSERLARRSLIVIFSDFTDNATAEPMVEHLGLLARRHLILYVALRDPALQRMALPVDITLDSVAEAVSADQIAQERRLVLDRLERVGVLCLDTEPDALTADLVSRYIEIKARERL